MNPLAQALSAAIEKETSMTDSELDDIYDGCEDARIGEGPQENRSNRYYQAFSETWSDLNLRGDNPMTEDELNAWLRSRRVSIWARIRSAIARTFA